MNKLTARDLINCGVFSIIYFIIMYASGMIGMAGPAFIFVGGALSILINGIVVMLYLSRVPKFGALTITSLLIALLMGITHGTPHVVVSSVLTGLIADAIQSRLGKATSLEPRRGLVAYAVFSLWTFGMYLPALLNPESYFGMVAQGWGADYAEGLKVMFSPGVISVWMVVTFLLALLGGYVGQRALRRHFERAGVSQLGVQ